MTPTRRTMLTALGLTAGGATWLVHQPTAHAADPTTGWTQTPFDFTVQKPWDLPVSQRYSSSGGEHRLWVYDTDKPHTQSSNTDPRTEMRWRQEYSSGQHMWDADVYVPSGTNGATVMQILRVRGGAPGTPATDIMFNVYNSSGGSLKYFDRQTLKSGIYNRWFNMKVAHDAGTRDITVWFDNVEALRTTDRGSATRHFKNGVYHHGSGRAESRFRNVKYWRR
ncbi:cinnamyl alcohol dehydrogenase [Streptomyces sp. WMMC500]|uniref:cinnamyl alcohol dehydrogenase n=1 Tax=Streptomyces sp. WMMC500 TaxID=3015154 RepID=UPI00248B0264|nr:cinnamyl alcohol dehydrogenase [Streptomyces sp. WMMC500]WBB59181.1 cinnamyl alcohol dehydrogenase [Streptomyces sp. WMMC500]